MRLFLRRTAAAFIWPIAMLTARHAHAQNTGIVYVQNARTAVNAHEYDSGLIYADMAIEKALQQKDTLSQLKALRFKGKALLGLKRDKESAEAFFAALRLSDKTQYNEETGFIYGELGYYYLAQGNGIKAKEYYQKNFDVLSSIYGIDSMGNHLINLSVCHQRLENFDSARILLDKVQEITARNNDSSMRAYYELNMGAYYTEVNQPDSARLCYLRAYELWKALGNEQQLFKVTFNLGFFAFQKKDYREALKYYHLSESAAAKYGQKRELAHVYGTMAEAYAVLKDYSNAYEYLYRYATMNDSFSKEDINAYAIKLDKQFETDKARHTIQEQELELKQKENTILIIIIGAIVLISLGGAAFVWVTFRSRLRKKVEEAKERFFTNVAHEIRTPLAMIKGPIELLQQQVQNEEQLQHLATAARNTQRLNDLINQMLDISKIDADKYILQEHAGDPVSFVANLARQYETQAAEKNISLSCTYDQEIQAFFDRDALEKITGNLIGNAIKYTPAGGNAGVDITTVREQSSVTLTVTVWDSGPGIPVQEQQKIFDRFYRSESKARGTGIGLALAAELATLMNGSVTVNSTPGNGAVFTVTCQLRYAGSTGSTADSTTEPDAPHILLAEDDAEILAFNTTLLQQNGYKVTGVSDGNTAAEMAEKILPDLIVTDLMMPGKDGIALVQYIRNHELTTHIPVVVLSAKGAQHTRNEALAAGAQVYLAKPFSPAELAQTITNQLQLLQRNKERYQDLVSNTEETVTERLQHTDPFTQKCHELILEHIDDASFTVEKMAELMNVNRSHFQRKIKTLTGTSPSEMIKTIRLEKARELLLRRESNITETAYATGFTSQSYFTRCFTERFGYPPSDVLKQHP